MGIVTGIGGTMSSTQSAVSLCALVAHAAGTLVGLMPIRHKTGLSETIHFYIFEAPKAFWPNMLFTSGQKRQTPLWKRISLLIVTEALVLAWETVDILAGS